MAGSKFLGVLAACLAAVACGCGELPPPQPNFVILLADDLGYCGTELYSCDEIPTPNIRRIAENGVTFTDGYVTAGTCSPSRAGLLTGRYQQRFGFEFNTGPARLTFEEKRGLPEGERTIADILGEAGYATGLVGKWHQGNTEGFHPTERGFNEFFGFLPGARAYFEKSADSAAAASRRVASDHPQARLQNIEQISDLNALYRGRERVSEAEYLTDAFAREAVSFIERHRDDPFLLYVAFNAPHTPIEATTEYVERFSHIADPHRRIYAAMVSSLDDAVGRILDTLEHAGLAEDTLVVFLSDNGCAVYTQACTNDPLRLGKLFLFEGGTRVPFAMQYPRRIDGGQVYRHPVSSLDILPTLAALAGGLLPADRETDGRDLMPFLSGEESPPQDALFWRNGENKAVRQGNWKLFWNQRHAWLFDLSEDIGEITNLAGEHPQKVKALQGLHRDWETGMVDPLWPARLPAPEPVEVDGVLVDINI